MTDYNRDKDRLDHGPAQPVNVERPETDKQRRPGPPAGKAVDDEDPDHVPMREKAKD